MTTLNVEHLIEQAERLILPSRAGPPRQVDLRRAISSAYYAVFHLCMTSVADEFIGATLRNSGRYALLYRSINHRTLKDFCTEARKQAPSAKFLPYFPVGGFSANIRAFAGAVVELQQNRHEAGYDPQPRFASSDANAAISAAKSAIAQFRAASDEHRKIFLTLLVCPPR